MSDVVSFKVPREIKEKMKRYSKQVKWSEELRSYIIERIRSIEAEDNLKRVVEMIESTKGVPEGFSVRSIREGRDS